MRKSGEVHETLLLWRKRAAVGGEVREVRCLADHLGEGLFELRLESGHGLLQNEIFDDAETLLARADELRQGSPVRPT